MAIVFPEGTQDYPSKVTQIRSYHWTGQYSGSGRETSWGSFTITPTSSSNKVIVVVSMNLATGGTTTGFQIRRNNGVVNTLVGDQWGSSRRRFSCVSGVQTSWQETSTLIALDTPGTTSTTTYNIYVGSHDGRTWYINRSSNTTDNSDVDNATTISTIHLIEVEDT